MKTHLINGWAEWFGKHTVAKFKQYIPETEEYGHITLFPSLTGVNKTIAWELIARSTDEDMVIAFSNGCKASLRAIEMGANFRRVLWIAPALRPDIEIPDHFTGRIHILYSLNDWVGYIAAIIGFIFRNRWGDMMRIGYHGPPDDRIESWCGKPWHLGWFKDDEVFRMVQYIEEVVIP